MVRRNLQFIPGGYYHIYNRGAGRLSIFTDDPDYRYVLRAMKRISRSFYIAVIAYCLMPNHYHWLVRQDSEAPTRLLPQHVFNGYVKAFNRRHSRSGTLFEGPFKAKVIDNDEYLCHLCRYIHLNPVKDGFATAPDLWPYSNYLEWIGLRSGDLIDRDFVHSRFPDPQIYRQYVLAHLSDHSYLPDPLRWYLESLT